MQSVHITTNVVSSNSAQDYVIKFDSELRRLFSPGTPVSYTNKADHPDITEILLKRWY
jgi:hypothetical protein